MANGLADKAARNAFCKIVESAIDHPNEVAA